jgi:hypothetical protein
MDQLLIASFSVKNRWGKLLTFTNMAFEKRHPIEKGLALSADRMGRFSVEVNRLLRI